MHNLFLNFLYINFWSLLGESYDFECIYKISTYNDLISIASIFCSLPPYAFFGTNFLMNNLLKFANCYFWVIN